MSCRPAIWVEWFVSYLWCAGAINSCKQKAPSEPEKSSERFGMARPRYQNSLRHALTSRLLAPTTEGPPNNSRTIWCAGYTPRPWIRTLMSVPVCNRCSFDYQVHSSWRSKRSCQDSKMDSQYVKTSFTSRQTSTRISVTCTSCTDVLLHRSMHCGLLGVFIHKAAQADLTFYIGWIHT